MTKYKDMLFTTSYAVRICCLSQLQPALKTIQDVDAHLNDAATGLYLSLKF